MDFLIDGQLGWTEKRTPYDYGDDGDWLVTSLLSAGRHVFQTRLVTPDGKTVTDTVTATVAPPGRRQPS